MHELMGEYTLDVNRDDRGRIVAELWHNASGKTLAITEVDSQAAARAWAKQLLALRGEK